MLLVHSTGDYIKEFDPTLTGNVNFDERVARAQNVLYNFKF